MPYSCFLQSKLVAQDSLCQCVACATSQRLEVALAQLAESKQTYTYLFSCISSENASKESETADFLGPKQDGGCPQWDV